MAAPMTENDPTCFCKNCKRYISERNFGLHEATCQRHTRLCDKCGEPVCKSEMEEHMKSHELVLCKCNIEVEKAHLERHEEEECSHRMVQCKFCEMSLKGKELEEHEYTCGSRTEQCDKCFNYIILRDFQTHDCSVVIPKQTKTPMSNDDFTAEYLDSSAYRTNGYSPLWQDISSFDFGSFRQSATREVDFHMPPDGTKSRFNTGSNSVDMDSTNSSHGPSSATLPAGALSRGGASSSKHVVSKGSASGTSNDNVTDTFESLNIHGTGGIIANGTVKSRTTNHKPNGTERTNIRTSKSSSKSNRMSKSRRPDNTSSIAIQGRSLQPDVITQTAKAFDNDVVADSGRVRNRSRNGRNRLKKVRQIDVTKKDTDPLLNGSTGSTPTPIQAEERDDEDIKSDMQTDSQSNPVAEVNIVDEIPCEICDVLVNLSDLEGHQRRCLLEQQEALQTFGNRMPETPPDIVEVEKIVIDDDKYDSDTMIPCEFCKDILPANDCILHQPYCDKNPNKHPAVDTVDFRSTSTHIPFSGQSAGFWESRVDEQPFSMDIPAFQQPVSPYLFPDFNEEMNNDASNSEDESPAFRSERRHWR